MAKLAAKQQASAPKNSLYFVNGPVDYLFMGASSILLLIFLILVGPTEKTPSLLSISAFMLWVVNWPHFSMTCNRLYQSKHTMSQYPFTAFSVPFLIFGGIIGCFQFPEFVAPYFVKLFLIWSPYHFSGQTVGITLLYARRAGLPIHRWQRLALSSFVFGTFILSTARAEISRTGHHYYGIRYPGLGLPQWFVDFCEFGMWFALVVFVAFCAYAILVHKRRIPFIIFLLPFTQYLWFVQAVYLPSFQEFVPLFHSLQYILIAWVMQLKEKIDVRGDSPSRRYAMIESLRWGVVNICGGAALFWVLPMIGSSLGYSLAFSTGVLISAVNIHHFLVDGVIWKLKNSSVSSPLMANARDFTGTPNLESTARA